MSDVLAKCESCGLMTEAAGEEILCDRCSLAGKEIERLRAELKRLRAQYDADPEPPSDEDIAPLCSVCGGATNQLRRRGTWWVCVGCWKEDQEQEA